MLKRGDVLLAIVFFTIVALGRAALADNRLNLPALIEDAFHVALFDPEAINAARGYYGKKPPPKNRALETNLWSHVLHFDPNAVPTCEDFSFKSWNDWREKGMRDGEIMAFGYWNTPVHVVSRIGKASFEGVIAVDSRIEVESIVTNGEFSKETIRRLLQVRGGYQQDLLNWSVDKTILVEELQRCEGFSIFNIWIQ